MPVKEGFGFLGTLLYDDIEDKIQCHVCGELFTQLTHFHLRKHELTTPEYKEKFGLNKMTALMTPTLSERKSLLPQNKIPIWKKMSKADFKRFNERRLKGYKNKDTQLRKETNYGRRYTYEMMNRFGSCPLQVEERFIRVTESLGRTPKELDLIKADSGLLDILIRKFKTYSNALNHFGLKLNKRSSRRDYNTEYLSKLLKIWVKEKRRVPTHGDTLKGYLPHYQTLKRHFGTWQAVQDQAEVYLYA